MDKSEKDMYGEIYRSAKSGADTILALLPRVKNEQLMGELTTQLDGYLSFASRAESGLAQCHEKPKEVSKAKTFATKAGIAAETMFDASPSHIAELLIRENSDDVVSLDRARNKAERSIEPSASVSEAYELGGELLSFRKKNLERMRKYL